MLSFLRSIAVVLAIIVFFFGFYSFLIWLAKAANKKWPRFKEWFLPFGVFLIIAVTLALLPITNLQLGQIEILNDEQTRDIRIALSIAIFVYAALEIPFFFHHFKRTFSEDFLNDVALKAACVRDEEVAAELSELKEKAIQEINECVEDCIITQVYDKQHLKDHGEKRLKKYHYNIVKARTGIDFQNEDPLYKYISDNLESLFTETYYKNIIYDNEFWKAPLREILENRIELLRNAPKQEEQIGEEEQKKIEERIEERIGRLQGLLTGEKAEELFMERIGTLTLVHSSMATTEFRFTNERYLHLFSEDKGLPEEEYFFLDSIKVGDEKPTRIKPNFAHKELGPKPAVFVDFHLPEVTISPDDEYKVVIRERSIIPIDDTYNWRVREGLYLKGKLAVEARLKGRDYNENDRPHIEIFCREQKKNLKEAEDVGTTGRKREYNGLMLPGDGFVISWPF